MKKTEMMMEISTFFKDRGYAIDNKINLFEAGAIDSMSIIELAIFIEQRFDVRLTPLQMNAEHFKTLDSIFSMLDGIID